MSKGIFPMMKGNLSDPIVLDSEQLRKTAQSQPADILTGLIREGEQVLLYSATGSYKSWLATAIWLAAANASEVAKTAAGTSKWRAPKGRKVLLIDGELDQYDLGDRLNKLCPNYGDASGLVLMRQAQDINVAFPDLASSDDQIKLIQYCHDEGVELLILDNLTTLANVADENASSAMKPLLDMLLKLKAAGIATVLVHHSNKGDNGYRGSTALATTFNAIIKLKRDKVERGLFSLVFEKARNNHIENQALNLRLLNLPDGSCRLEADAELSKLEVIVSLVRSLDYVDDNSVRAALALKLGEEVSQPSFSRFKKKAISETLISNDDWSKCLRDANDLAAIEL